jgi:hypothetical protein
LAAQQFAPFLNENGELMEEGRIGLTPAILKKTLPSTKVRIAIEAGAQSRWVSRLLKELSGLVGPDGTIALTSTV